MANKYKPKTNLFLERWKTLWEKEKMLITSIFAFSYDVFKKASMLGSIKVKIVCLRVNP